MIKSIEQLKLKLLEQSETERLDRHAYVKVAFAEQTDKNKMLTKALKQSQLATAELRSQLKNIMDAHMPLERRR